jgi:hypothetical protein
MEIAMKKGMKQTETALSPSPSLPPSLTLSPSPILSPSPFRRNKQERERDRKTFLSSQVGWGEEKREEEGDQLTLVGKY